MDLLPRFADIPNVTAMKFAGSIPLVQTVQAFIMIGDRVLVSDPMPDTWFITMPQYGQQWAGAGPFYMSQTPEDQRSVKLFNLLYDGKIDEAYDEYWKSVARSGGGGGANHSMDSYLETGMVSPVISKYGHWCLGGNGGLTRQPARRLYDFTREGIKAGIRAMGFTPRENDEEFFVGRVNYEKGIRLKRY